jgi:quinol monooxygenase YgiN
MASRRIAIKRYVRPMAIYQLARFEVRADACLAVEKAMHELASYVRAELPGSMWTTYRDPDAPNRFTAFLRADERTALERHAASAGVRAFEAAIAGFLVGEIERSEWDLVTSSDLAPRHRPRRR